MRHSSLLPLATLVLVAAPIRAQDPACLLFHSTVPSGSYSGSAALPGGSGGVLDRCSTFSDAAAWQLSNNGPGTGPSIPIETIYVNTPTTGNSGAPNAVTGKSVWAPASSSAAAGRQRHGQGAGAGVPVAEDARYRRACDAGGSNAGTKGCGRTSCSLEERETKR